MLAKNVNGRTGRNACFTQNSNAPRPIMVSIIVINWNGKRFLRECLQSLYEQTYQDMEALLIDNYSTDGSREMLSEYATRSRLFYNPKNIGYCGAANLGIVESRGDYLLILNPDVVLSPDYLRKLVLCAEQHPQVGSITGKLLRFDHQTLDSAGQFLRNNLTPLERGYNQTDIGQHNVAEYVFSACGAAAFYRRNMLEAIQIDGEYFDTSYFAFYEDLDIGWRAQLAGWKAYYLPDALAYHYRGGGFADKPAASWLSRLPFAPRSSFMEKPRFAQRHILKNRYLTLMKNAAWPEILLGLPNIARLELLIAGYVLFVHPSLLFAWGDLLTLLPQAWRKRQKIQARRVVDAMYIAGFLRKG